MKTNENNFELINNKLVITTTTANGLINSLPNGQTINEEFILELSLSIPEPDSDTTLEEKLEYHKHKNTEFINKIKPLFNTLVQTDISEIASEVWLVFKEKDHNILEQLTKLEEVNTIFIYEPSNDISYEPHSLNTKIDESEQEAIHQLEAKFSNGPLKIKPIDLNFIENLRIVNSRYDETTKTLTLDLSHYKKEEEIEQLFTYIYAKQINSYELLNRISDLICETIIRDYENKEIARINFDIESDNWGKNSPNRYIQILPVPRYTIVNKKEIEKFITSEYVFDQEKINSNTMRRRIENMIHSYSKLFKAITTNIYVDNEIKSINPETMELLQIEKMENKFDSLYVKFSIFDTQEKMNLLFSYLAAEPYNKKLWISRIQELIINGLKERNLGSITEYKFITFNEEFKNDLDIYEASIGAIDATKNTIEFESNDDIILELFANMEEFFKDENDLSEKILRNLSWNRHTYLNYNLEHEILYPESKPEKRSVFEYDRNLYYDNLYRNLINEVTINKVTSIQIKNMLKIELNHFETEEKLLDLFTYINGNVKGNAEKWINKLSSLIIKAIGDMKLELTKIKYISLLHSEHDDRILTIPSIGGYTSKAQVFGEQNPKEIVNDKGELLGIDSIKKGLYYYLESNQSRLNAIASDKGILPTSLEGEDFVSQFLAVGLPKYLEKVKKGEFIDITTNVGVLEVRDGIVNYEDKEYFGNLVIVNERDLKMRSYHADLVGRIACSSKSGVDKTSTLVSCGFNNDPKHKWNFFKSIEWMIKNRTKVINCSWGISKNSILEPYFYPYDALAYKIDYISRKFNIPIIIAAGNSHDQYMPPYYGSNKASFNSIVVGSTSKDGKTLSKFSDYGTYPDFNLTYEAPKPLLVAPGENYKYKNNYSDGTSFSSPLVTGAVSILMKEFSNLKENVAGVMATLCASSNDIYKNSNYNVNGLKKETGSGLLDYPIARVAAKNLISKEIPNNLELGEQVYVSHDIYVQSKQDLIVSVASLFNAGYINDVNLPNLLPTRGGISSAPILGYIYLSIVYHLNSNRQKSYQELFEKMKESLDINESINFADFDKSLLPTNLIVTIQKWEPIPERWVEAKLEYQTSSQFSNIKKYITKNQDDIENKYRYIVTVDRTSKTKYLDNTKEKIACTHVVRNV